MDYENIRGFNELTEEEKEVVKVVRKSQYDCVGFDNKHKFTLESIKYVKSSNRAAEFGVPIVEVHYQDDWYHYMIKDGRPQYF